MMINYDVKNCKCCKKIFTVSEYNIYHCGNCWHIHEEKFTKIKAYLEENPLANGFQIAEALNLRMDLIQAYITEYRLQPVYTAEYVQRELSKKPNLRTRLLMNGLNGMRATTVVA